MDDGKQARKLPTAQQVEAELNRELGRQRRFTGLRCLLYVAITIAIVALFVLFVVMPGRAIA